MLKVLKKLKEKFNFLYLKSFKKNKWKDLIFTNDCAHLKFF